MLDHQKYMFGFVSLSISAIIFLVMKNTIHPLDFAHVRNDIKFFRLQDMSTNKIFNTHILLGAHRLFEHGNSKYEKTAKHLEQIIELLHKQSFNIPTLYMQNTDELIKNFPSHWYNYHQNVLSYQAWVALYNEEEVYKELAKAKQALKIHDLDACLLILQRMPRFAMTKEANDWLEKFRIHLKNVIIIRQFIIRLLDMEYENH